MARRGSLGLRIVLVACVALCAWLTGGPQGFAVATKKKSAATDGAVNVPSIPLQPKRPGSSYMLWLSAERPKIVKTLGADAKVTDVSKEAGKLWATLSDTKKKPFEAQAAKAKDEYQTALEAFKAAGGVPKAKKTTATKDGDVPKAKKTKAKKEAKDPNKPKRPASAYMVFLKEMRADIVKSLPEGHKPTEVMTEAGKQWKELSDAIKKNIREKGRCSQGRLQESSR